MVHFRLGNTAPYVNPLVFHSLKTENRIVILADEPVLEDIVDVHKEPITTSLETNVNNDVSLRAHWLFAG